MNTVQVLLIDGGEVLHTSESVETRYLEKFWIVRKQNLSEGLRALREFRFQLVLLDLSFPDSPAVESLQETIRAARDLPVIVLVNQGDLGKAEEAVRLGAVDYVVKGCHCDAVFRTMHFAMERKRLITAAEQAGGATSKSGAQLTAHLSHELRNSLACIHQFGNILLDGLAGTVSDEQREYLAIMLANASQIRAVLDNALETMANSPREGEDKIAICSEREN